MSDEDYYSRRAECEVLLAQKARHPAAVAAHYQLSTAYLERVHAKPADEREAGA